MSFIYIFLRVKLGCVVTSGASANPDIEIVAIVNNQHAAEPKKNEAIHIAREVAAEDQDTSKPTLSSLNLFGEEIERLLMAS
ncbi:hypothetical protein GCK72_023810 [Caenorhabditis remanei]|uniref:Uncharacterized protein n=1 Tax=Caenorhabditis remanei TaxID=31234 RepID=A0A6A5FXF5_CAERE|nr:hypothetical protein GCK72_023810 [Caenorhabditis remanei]KAF1747348.1 hypothetical protein GCK72_023810 [Caenorhabditis remanei]